MKFNSAEEMCEEIYKHDLYSPSLNTYVFLYNDEGSIAVYDWIDEEEANRLQNLSKENNGEYWGAFLGPGGYIYDSLEYKLEENSCNEDELYDEALDWCSFALKANDWTKITLWKMEN